MTTQLDSPAPAWSARLISELTDTDERASALTKTLTRDQLNWRPRPGAWSIGQCLDHLHVTNEVYLPAMSAALTGRERGAVAEIQPGWLGRWFIRHYIEPSSGTKRARAPKKITPAADVDRSILDRFASSNQRAREFVHRAAEYDVNRIRFKNPFIPGLRFSVATGLAVLTAHQRRHLLQAERVRASPGFPV